MLMAATGFWKIHKESEGRGGLNVCHDVQPHCLSPFQKKRQGTLNERLTVPLNDILRY